MALAADRNIEIRDSGRLKAYPVAAATLIYKGSLVTLNTAGHAVPAADTASFVFVGIAHEKVDNTGAAGVKWVRCRTGMMAKLPTSGLTQAAVGLAVYAVDDDTVALAATTTNDVLVGKVVEFHSATSVTVNINHI